MRRVPDYYDRFQCLAGQCPHSCCELWEVVLDEDTAARYRAAEGELGQRLRGAMETVEGEVCFPLRGGRCPFLDGENLCEIHRAMGEEATSLTCRSHPRFIEEYEGLAEVSLAISCPAANDLLFSLSGPLTYVEIDDGDTAAEDPLFYLRGELFALLWGEGTLKERLKRLLALGIAAQSIMDDGEDALLCSLSAEDAAPPDWAGEEELFPAAAEFLGELEILGPDWAELLNAPAPLELDSHADALSRLCGYFLFRYVCKAMGDGDVLGKIQLAVLAVLTAAHYGGGIGIPEAARLFSREIEHSEENLQALAEGFCLDQRLTLERFFTSLK